MRLSYSQINEVYTCPHNRLNKIMGIKQPENKYSANGKRLHRIIQDHVSGAVIDQRLSHLKLSFPIVETVDFDPKCEIVFPILKKGETLTDEIKEKIRTITAKDLLNLESNRFPLTEAQKKQKELVDSVSQFWMIGYFDGIDLANRRTLEIKTSSKKWSMADFQKAMQRGVYAIALPMIEENVLIYAHSDDSLWHVNKPKEFVVPVTQEHIDKTWEWLRGGIERIQNLKDVVAKELEPTGGKCADPRCYYGEFCQFK